jgi:ribosomal protein S18 acetylase RimI-like enzyme
MRHVIEEDIADLVELEQILFEENWLSDVSLLRELAAPGMSLIEGSPAIGYILSRWTDYLIDITRLGVLPEAQGRGVGCRLLDAVLLAADRPVMLTVRKNNARALRLYRSRSFRIVGQLRDAWTMLR